MVPRAKEREDSDSDDHEGNATSEGEAEKKAFFMVESVPLHFTRELRNLISSNFSRKAHHVNVCEESVHFWRKGSSDGDVQSQVN